MLLERDGALRDLRDALASARSGRGRVALVCGEAGIGKTSVIREFTAGLDDTVSALTGGCDDLAVARPLAPWYDMAANSSKIADLLAGADVDVPRAIHSLLCRRVPTVCVIEDAHWADDATLDVLTFLARRIGDAPVLVVLSYRDDEVGPAHPLRRVLGALPAGAAVYVELEPLSPDAVARLAGEAEATDDLHAQTGGNPFFVTEALASGLGRTPASVRDAVLARASRLPDPAREVTELVSVSPGRVHPTILATCLPDLDVDAALDDAVSGGLLEASATDVGFRHELARRAIEEGIRPTRAAALHRAILHALRECGAPEALLAHHAWRAGDLDATVRHGLAAGRRAAAAHSHREAADLLARALEHQELVGPGDLAGAWELLSTESFHAGRLESAISAARRTLEIHRARGDDRATGAALRWLSRLQWVAIDRQEAERLGAEAVALLEPLGPGRELAMALSNLSQLDMLAQRNADAARTAQRVIDMARTIGDTETLLHAQVNHGSARLVSEYDRAVEDLIATAAEAIAAGVPEEACRGLINAGWTAIDRLELGRGERICRRALQIAIDYELGAYIDYIEVNLGHLQLMTGDWDSAYEAARRALERHATGPSINRMPALWLLGTIELRRGDPRAAERLDEAWALATATDEFMRIRPNATARAEAAWLREDPAGVDEATRYAYELACRFDASPAIGALAVWRARAGVLDRRPDGELPRPADLELAGDHAGAAREWERIGAPYHRALTLAASGSAALMLDALPILDALGATATAARTRRRLRRMGVRGVPRGPHRSTRSDPSGLTARQREVLDLIGRGLTNAQISERLVLSQKTVEHHVAAILARLGVTTRRDAIDAARERET